MPTPMNFREEGGASLSPDGTKFLAVSMDAMALATLNCIVLFVVDGRVVLYC